MKSLLKLLIKQFGYLFEDYPLESGLALIILSSVALYLIRNRIFYIKNRISILYYFFNLRTLFYVLVFIGISQVLRGLNIYDSILNDVLGGIGVLHDDYPIVLGSIITAIGVFFIYEKLKIADEEIEELESDINKYKFWLFNALIIFIGVSMILRNI